MSMRFKLSEHVSLGDALQAELETAETLQGFVEFLGTNEMAERGSSHFLGIVSPFLGTDHLNELEAIVQGIAGDRELRADHYILFKETGPIVQVLFKK